MTARPERGSEAVEAPMSQPDRVGFYLTAWKSPPPMLAGRTAMPDRRGVRPGPVGTCQYGLELCYAQFRSAAWRRPKPCTGPAR